MADITPKQQRFVEEYLVDLNATQAAIRAGYSAASASEQASRLLGNVNIQAQIAEGRKSLQEKVEFGALDVLKQWVDVVRADPNELTQFRRTACRHCHGARHNYQWIDETEYLLAAANPSVKKRGNLTKAGGYGYAETLPPNPKCPHCNGEGRGRAFFADTRYLSPAGKALFAGVKVTKDGVEIKMHDRSRALENLARHFGMYLDKAQIELNGKLTLEQLILDSFKTPAQPTAASAPTIPPPRSDDGQDQ